MSLINPQATKSLLCMEDKTTKAGEFSVNFFLIHVEDRLFSSA